jgi:hypothetical protein
MTQLGGLALVALSIEICISCSQYSFPQRCDPLQFQTSAIVGIGNWEQSKDEPKTLELKTERIPDKSSIVILTIPRSTRTNPGKCSFESM